MNKNKLPIDAEAVDLLKRVQAGLATSLDSLAGTTTEGAASYLVWGATHINRTVAGYISLRESRLLHPSKLLVRPVLEVTFYVRAALLDPEFLLHKAFSEMLEDARFTAPVKANKKTIEKVAKEEFERLRLVVVNELPAFATVVPKAVTAQFAAEAARLTPAYQNDFRLYCQFMHGALRAIGGGLDSLTDQRDTPLMIWCALIICEALKKHSRANVVDLVSFWNELRNIADPTPREACN